MLTDECTGTRERIVLTNETHCVGVALFVDERDIARNIHACRTQRDTGHRLGQSGDAAMVNHVLDIVFPEALHAAQYHLSRLGADGAIGRIGNDARGLFDQVDGFEICLTAEYRLDQSGQLTQTDTAGRALTTGLRAAQTQERERHVDWAQSRRAGGNAAFYVTVETFHHCLCAAGRLDVHSAHKPKISPFALKYFLSILVVINGTPAQSGL